MHRRFEVLWDVIIRGLIVTLYILFFRRMLISPAYSLLSPLDLLVPLIGGVSLSTGIKKIREAKAHGVHIPWWKQRLIIISLVCGSTGAMILASLLIPEQVNKVLRNSILSLFFLFSLGLFIYLFILEYQQRIMNRPKQPQENRKMR
jgi:hypothetical protein